MSDSDTISGGARNLRLGMPNIKKFEDNTQYNEQLNYHGHNKSIIITSGSLLRASAGALVLRRLRSVTAGVAVAQMGRSGGESRTVERRFEGQAEGRGPRASGALERTRSRGTGARGEPQAKRQREQFFCILGFVELEL